MSESLELELDALSREAPPAAPADEAFEAAAPAAPVDAFSGPCEFSLSVKA